MDEKKALFRSRMRQAAERKEKRIDSPLVRYNDLGQPVCKVCNVPIKTESLWAGHLASRPHKEAAEELKERARQAKQASESKASCEPEELSEQLPIQPSETIHNEPDVQTDVNQDAKGALPQGFFDNTEAPVKEEETKGSLPQGFFDSTEADMKARGVQLPKIDIQEELKEFEKLIEGDVKAVEDRLAEEQVDAAEIREEEEEIEQSMFIERINELRSKRMKLTTEEKAETKSPVKEDNLSDELPSSDDESDEELVIDWRAKRS